MTQRLAMISILIPGGLHRVHPNVKKGKKYTTEVFFFIFSPVVSNTALHLVSILGGERAEDGTGDSGYEVPRIVLSIMCPEIRLYCVHDHHILSCHRQYLSSKNSLTVNGTKSSLQHLFNFCPHSLTIFSLLLPQTIYVFPYSQSPICLCGYHWPSWPFLPLINK